jgi:hypothetical protein
MVSLLFVAVVFVIGAAVVRAIAIIPLSILDRAAQNGRYARLGSADRPSPGTPVAGRRAATLCGSRRHGMLITGVHI